LYSLLFTPTNAQHIYKQYFIYRKALLLVSVHLHRLQGALTIYFAKVIKIIKFTNLYDFCNFSAVEV